ncbi:MAG TPA: M48 family metallopeptidase [Verrucomicrobiae bacterium]|nr:M48 family metallopeptidase [Verrucomicrobiae bacterium]
MSDSTVSGGGQKSYQALGAAPELGGGLQPGKVTISGGIVRFEAGGGVVEWRLEEIRLSLGGHDNKQLFLTRADNPKATLSTSDLSLLDEPAFQHSSLREQIARTRKLSKTIPRGLMGCGLFLLLLLIGLTVLIVRRDQIVESLANKVPIEWEVEFGAKLFQDFSRNEKLVTNNAAYNAQIQAITNALLPALGRAPLVFHFHVIENTNLNAFAVPGGHVFIFTGLLETVKRPEQLAGVVAHEIAHVTRRHSMRNVISSAGLWVIISSLVGDAEGIVAVLADGSQFLIGQKFSRDFEREADDTGWGYLIAANVDPRGMIEFFETMKAEQDKTSSGKMANTLDFLSTHPATDERMKRMRAKWDALPRKTGFRSLGAEKGN